jgi:NAD-dependent dihydropyrimidine dehydrogenase PreA subunit
MNSGRTTTSASPPPSHERPKHQHSAESCPVDCLAIDPATGKSHMKFDDCWYCLACEVDCPTNAITVKIPFLIR